MFLFAILTGLRNNWLDRDTFLDPAKKGWSALVGYLQGGKLTNVAAGFWPSTGGASDYLNASRGQPGDSHGTAAFLWAATAAYRYFNDGPTSVGRRPPRGRVAGIDGLHADASFDLKGRAISRGRRLPGRTAASVAVVRGASSKGISVGIRDRR
jgi:hypothetical protein